MVSALILIADGTEEMELSVFSQIKSHSLTETCGSTITYDTLVRAGVKTRSAYVPSSDSELGTSASINPPAAKCSRGISIIPDAYFEPEKCGPVSLILFNGV
jgi:protein DJ-1